MRGGIYVSSSPDQNQSGLIADLKGRPVCRASAPLTAALTPIKLCQFEHRCPAVISDENQADGREPSGEARTRQCQRGLRPRCRHRVLLKG